MTNFDSTPSSVYVTDISIDKNLATMQAVDEDDTEFTVTLDVTRYPCLWFAGTIDKWLDEHVSFDLISQYDSNADEWFCYAGNYGIFSRDLHFTPKA